MDGSVVKNAALALQGQTGNTAAAQRQIIEGLLSEVYTLGSEVNILAVMAEGTKKFSKAERKQQPSAYQYASRLKSIVGACLFAATDVVIEDKAIPAYTLTGDVNTMYAEAVKALRVRDLDWQGEKVSEAKAAKAAEKLNTRLGIEMYKQSQIAHPKPAWQTSRPPWKPRCLGSRRTKCWKRSASVRRNSPNA